MRLVLSLLPALGCGAVMFACVRMMAGRSHGESGANREPDRELSELREEVARLKSERADAGEDSSSSSPAAGG